MFIDAVAVRALSLSRFVRQSCQRYAHALEQNCR